MDLDLRRQRELDSVELVSGLGESGGNRMCIMALVARLAGEGHTDSPACASPLVRAYAIPINDHMPRRVRQRLKPFAPRILGTADGRDAARAEALRRILAEEILPGLRARAASEAVNAADGLHRAGRVRRLWARLRRAGLERRIRRLSVPPPTGRRGREAAIELAGAAGRLLAWSAREAADPRAAEWCWGRALDLLDRLCEAGRDAVTPVAPPAAPTRSRRAAAA
jgi:hypothetical protein